MSLLRRIDERLILSLSGSSSSGRSAATTAIGTGYQNTGASSVDFSKGIDTMRSAFSRSYLRMNEAVGTLQIAQDALGQLLGIAEELYGIAELAAKPSTGVNRPSLNREFAKLVREFKNILQETEDEGVNLLDKGELAEILEKAGIDLSAVTGLSQSFQKLAKSDGRLGYSQVRPIDQVLRSSTYKTLGDGTFTMAVSYPAGSTPSYTTYGDFNSDSLLDIVVANGTAAGGNSVTVLLGNADGSFAAARSFTVPDAPAALAVGDLNRSGYDDIVSASYSTGAIGVLLSNGDGTFTTAVSYAAGSSLSTIALGDFNKDLKIDVAAADRSLGTINVLLGNGDGTLSGVQSYAVGASPHSLIAADLNGDGWLDLLNLNRDENSVTVLLNNGDGTFASAATYQVGSTPQGLAMGYFDDDSSLDLAVVNQGDSSTSILLGNGDGTFQAAGSFLSGSAHSALSGDWNGDGLNDLITFHPGSDNFQLWQSNGDGTFAPTTSYTIPTPYFGSSEDLDFDGSADIAVPSSSEGTLSIYLGNSQTVPSEEVGWARATRDPLDNNLSTRAGALLAKDQMKLLLKDLKNDIKNLDVVLEEMSSGMLFSLQGFHSSSLVLEQIRSYTGAGEAASKISTDLMRASRSLGLDAHEIDGKLAADLLK